MRNPLRRQTASIDHGRRAPVREATLEQLVKSGATGWSGGDGVDDEAGFRSISGPSGRPVPAWTREQAVRHSVAAYRTNPMARSIIETQIAFIVGDSGVTVHSSVPEVNEIASGFWTDPRNAIDQERMLRSHLLEGESLYEMMVGATTGVVRRSVIDTGRIRHVGLLNGNPLWIDTVSVADPQVAGAAKVLPVVQPNDVTGLYSGLAMFWASFQALETDTRGYPFLSTVLDWVDNYEQVMNNLVDRTALSRYLVWDVEIDGDDTAVKQFVKDRGSLAPPRSGSIEVHNKAVNWKPLTAQSGAFEDTATAASLLTSVAAGAGLSKPWLAETDDVNKATSWSMAEPVRRRIGSIQKTWLARQTEMVRYAVDQAVIAGRLPALVDAPDGRRVLASSTVTVTGPALAATDAKITAGVLVSLSRSLSEMVAAGLLTPEAARVAVRKGWEDYVGVPWRPELDDLTSPDADTDDIATELDATGTASPPALAGTP